MNILRRLFKPNVAKMEREGNVPGLVKALQYPDQTIRYASTCALLRLGATEELAQIRPPVIDLLIQALADSDESIRWPAVTTLGRIGHPSAIEPLVAVLKDVDWEMRRAAAQALGQIGDVRAVEPLIAVLEDANGDVRQGAAQALGQIGDTRAVEPLVATLEDADGNVRRGAAQALGQIGDARAVEPLIVILKDWAQEVRQAAAYALAQIGDARAVEPLIAVLQDADSNVRQTAAQALIQIGEPSVELLIATLEDTSSNVRQAAAQTLGQIGDVRAVEPLVATLEDADSKVRQTAAEALDELGWRPGTDSIGSLYSIAKYEWHNCVQIGEPSVEPLIATLEDVDSNVRRGAAQALGQIGDTRAVEPLIAVLEDADSNVRRYAVYALGQIGDTRAVEPLIGVLEDADGGVRQAAVQALGQVGDPCAVEPLTTVLKDKDWQVRQVAAGALVRIGIPSVEPLIAVLEDADSNVRRYAVYALGQIGDTRAVEPLIGVLDDANGSVRQTAAEALDQLDWKPSTALIGSLYCIAKREWRLCVQIGKPSVEPLIATLEDADSYVRRGAAHALGQIGDTRAIEPLIAILTREGTRVHWDVVGALRSFDTPRAKAALRKFRGKGLIACIDDNRTVYDFIRPVLESVGFRVLWARDGVSGLELIRRAKPDLVLLDLGIPRMHGWEVCQRIRTDNDLQDVLVLVMSAELPHVSDGPDLRVDGWLSKPFGSETLLGVIESVLAGREWE